MKDARNIEIQIGDQVTLSQQRHHERYGWSTMSWGTVVKIMKKMVAINVGNSIINKVPHNVIVVNLPDRG